MAEQKTGMVGSTVKTNAEQKKREPIDAVLKAGPPYPLVVLPVTGDYWQEGTNHICSYDSDSNPYIPSIDISDLVIEDDVGYCCYKNFFRKQEHYNFTAECSIGSLLLSTKYEDNCVGSGEEEGEIVRVILRSSEKTVRGAVATKELSPCPGPVEIVKAVVPDLLDDFSELNFQPVIYPKASSLITRFDEHGHAEKFKVGIIYQKANQTHEGQYFGNQSHSKAMQDFLVMLGDEVDLLGFKGYSGGLDTKNNQTGHKSIYTNFKGREIMFHVSTLLPFTEGDTQQLQRKRHVGNDIIAIIFQDENTPFCPSSIRSSFLHIFIVVQVVEPDTKNTRYKITITSKEDVPEFGPSLPNPSVFSKNDPLLREYFLTKLLNAELAAFKAKQFSTLMERTRKLLFEDLVSTLAKKSQEMLNSGDSLSSSHPKGKLLNSLRNAFRSESFDRGPESGVRSRSLENLVEKEDKSDDDAEKTRKKKRNYHIKRYSVSEKTRKTFRPKPKSLFHSVSADSTNGRMNGTRQERVPSPTSGNRDHSPSGSFTPPRSPVDDQTETPPISPPSTLERVRPLPRNHSESYISMIDEAAFHNTDKVNGLSSSSKFCKDGTYKPPDNRVSSLPSKQKALSDSDATEVNQKNESDLKNVQQGSLIETLRGDVYKLSKEKSRLLRDNEALREDVNAIKDAMIKQAEDLCESQYQLTLIRARIKQKEPLTASVV